MRREPELRRGAGATGRNCWQREGEKDLVELAQRCYAARRPAPVGAQQGGAPVRGRLDGDRSRRPGAVAVEDLRVEKLHVRGSGGAVDPRSRQPRAWPAAAAQVNSQV
eukprot:SAG31_NODE_1321_length_8801_cov_7.086532_5_plen_108_part_00